MNHDTDHEAAIEKHANPTCRVCGGVTKRGVCIPPAIIEISEGTMSEGAWVDCAKLVTVWKCEKCGHSFTDSAPPQPAPEPTSGAAEQQCGCCRKPVSKCGCIGKTIRAAVAEKYDEPAPTPTDVSAAAREAAERKFREGPIQVEPEFQPAYDEMHENGKRNYAEAYQDGMEAQRATDRQRIAELEEALRNMISVVETMKLLFWANNNTTCLNRPRYVHPGSTVDVQTTAHLETAKKLLP